MTKWRRMRILGEGGGNMERVAGVRYTNVGPAPISLRVPTHERPSAAIAADPRRLAELGGLPRGTTRDGAASRTSEAAPSHPRRVAQVTVLSVSVPVVRIHGWMQHM